MRSYAAALAICLSGCATSTQIVGPDGQATHSIRCGAAVPDACLQKAGELCPMGYSVLTTSNSRYLGQFGTGGVSGSWNSHGGSISGAATTIPLVTPNTMLISCKAGG